MAPRSKNRSSRSPASQAIKDATLAGRLGLYGKWARSFSKARKNLREEKMQRDINSAIREAGDLATMSTLLPKVDPNQILRETRLKRNFLTQDINKLPRKVKVDFYNFLIEKRIPKNELEAVKKTLKI